MYKMYTDGGSRGNPGPAGLGAIIFDENDNLIWFENYFLKNATNNQAEYSALILGLKTAKKKNIKNLHCYLDSELVVKQINGEYKIKNDQMKKLFGKVEDLLDNFNVIKFSHVKRSKNKFADKLVNLALDSAIQSK